MNAQCSFCGASSESGARMIQGGGADVGGLPAAHICEECIESSYEALRTERRIGEARASEAPPPNSAQGEQRTAFGRITDWTSFEMEGQKLEWRAERTLATSRLPMVLLTVRERGGRDQVVLELEGNTEPDAAHAIEGASWLAASARSAELGPIADWKPLDHAGKSYEWRAVRVLGVRARPAVWVHVRNATTGVGSMMQFDGDTEPSVEDAVMVASESEDLLAPGD